jgi:hypothetical protein
MQGPLSLTNPASGTSLSRLPGAVAQLGERCNRTAEVRGSIPLSSMAGGRKGGLAGSQVRLGRELRRSRAVGVTSLEQSDGQLQILLPAPFSPLPVVLCPLV